MGSSGVSGLEAGCKFFQLVLTIASGALLLDLGEKKGFFINDDQNYFIVIVTGATLLVVVLQLVGMLLRALTPKILAIIIAIVGVIVWSAVAVIELRAYYYFYPKGIEDDVIGRVFTSVLSSITSEYDEIKYKFLAMGVLTAFNALLLLLEVCGVCIWRDSVAQRGVVFQRV